MKRIPTTVTIEEIQGHLERFRKAYHSTRVNVYDTYMVYRCAAYCAVSCVTEANLLIAKLRIPLVAVATEFHLKDSFVVKSTI